MPARSRTKGLEPSSVAESAIVYDALTLVVFCSRRVLRLSSGIDVMGPVMWDLALSLILAWIITFFALFRGIKTSGKVECERRVLAIVQNCGPSFMTHGIFVGK